MEEIAFTPGSVPVVVVARVYGKRCFLGSCRVLYPGGYQLEKLLEMVN